MTFNEALLSLFLQFISSCAQHNTLQIKKFCSYRKISINTVDLHDAMCQVVAPEAEGRVGV